MGTCVFFFGGEPKKSVEELGETKLDNYIFQAYQNQPTKTSTDENFGWNCACFGKKTQKLSSFSRQNRQVEEEYHAASTSLTSVGILHQQVPIVMRKSVDLVGRENVLKGFFESSVSLNFSKPPQLFRFYPKKKTLNISYINLPLSTMEVAKLASLSKSYKEPNKGEDESLTYLDLLDLVGFFWVNFGRHFTHNHRKDPGIFYPGKDLYR